MEKNALGLRDWISARKVYYTKNGPLEKGWQQEGIAWAIQSFYSMKSSLLYFTTNDWDAAADEGWSKEKVGILCLGTDDLNRVLETYQFHDLEIGDVISQSYYDLFRKLQQVRVFSQNGYEDAFQFYIAAGEQFDRRYGFYRPKYITFAKKNGRCYFIGYHFYGETNSTPYMGEVVGCNSDPGYRRVRVKKYGYIVLPGPDDAALEAVKNISDGDVDWGDIETNDAEIVENCREDGSI